MERDTALKLRERLLSNENDSESESELESALLLESRDQITEMKGANPFGGENDDINNNEKGGFRKSRVAFSPVRRLQGSSQRENNEDHILYWPLFKAIQENDWKGVEEFVTKDGKVLTSKIKICKAEPFFHIITRNLDTPIWLMEKLIKEVSPESLEKLKDYRNQSVIFRAARYGNRKAAEVFVHRNSNLPNQKDNDGCLPIHIAALAGHKEMVQFLLSVTETQLDGDKGVEMLCNLINFDIYDIALDLLKRYPNLAREPKNRGSILSRLANRALAFESGSRMGYLERLIYKLIPLQEEQVERPVNGDMENPSDQRSQELTKFTNLLQISIAFGSLCQKLHIFLWNVLMQLAPIIKGIRDAKLMHKQTLEIVRIMCHKGIIWSDEEFNVSLHNPFLTAARLGIYELVDEIQKAYFYSFLYVDKQDNGIFELAILHRQEKVFSFIKKMSFHLYDWTAANMNARKGNILHTAAKYVSSSEISGAALQMQRELQWFKAVESYVHPSSQEQQDENGKTPREVFTKAHWQLLKKGEKWMKDTASSCTLVAVLIITVVFAAAFTVPGGNNTEGLPVFLHQPSFLVFAVSDALALFSSTTSLLMFLSILTSRYAEDDFLESLPRKLIIGLMTLFFSIANMMVAFGAAIYIFLHHPWKWVIIPISLLGCVPVTSFGLLQFPLFLGMFSSTYRSNILQPSIKKK